jgi:hypothetical protein
VILGFGQSSERLEWVHARCFASRPATADRPQKQAVAWHWVTIMSSPKKMEVGM